MASQNIILKPVILHQFNAATNTDKVYVLVSYDLIGQGVTGGEVFYGRRGGSLQSKRVDTRTLAAKHTEKLSEGYTPSTSVLTQANRDAILHAVQGTLRVSNIAGTATIDAHGEITVSLAGVTSPSPQTRATVRTGSIDFFCRHAA